jgi:PKHD-type hydroxylase
MLVRIPQVLNAEQLAVLREQLDHAGDAWVDGRVTAGYSGAPVKFNQQIDERSEAAAQCQHLY